MSDGTARTTKAGQDTVDITVPSDQREGNQATVHRWLKAVGDAVSKNEPILEINTDKVTLEVVAPVTGVLTEILKAPKSPCELSDVFGRISGAKPGISARKATSVMQADSGEVLISANAATARLSPAVRQLVATRGIDPLTVSGSGADGRVTARDVERASAAPSTATAAGFQADVLVPHTPMRRAIASAMSHSVTVAPHVTSVFECDFDAVLAHRAQLKASFAKRGVKLTVTPYLVRAAALALNAVPEVNASWHDDHLALHPNINIGIATAVERSQGGGAGLIVPVVKNVDKLDLFSIAQEVQRYAEAGRLGKLSPADLAGGTFTISNHGVSGSLLASPIIILHPQAAILGVGKVERRIVVGDVSGREVMEVRSRGYVTLTIDHRALDGFTANRFLTIFSEGLQNLPSIPDILR